VIFAEIVLDSVQHFNMLTVVTEEKEVSNAIIFRSVGAVSDAQELFEVCNSLLEVCNTLFM
jgi:hypothetical protein